MIDFNLLNVIYACHIIKFSHWIVNALIFNHGDHVQNRKKKKKKKTKKQKRVKCDKMKCKSIRCITIVLVLPIYSQVKTPFLNFFQQGNDQTDLITLYL